jgi:hypothetical protein
LGLGLLDSLLSDKLKQNPIGGKHIVLRQTPWDQANQKGNFPTRLLHIVRQSLKGSPDVS